MKKFALISLLATAFACGDAPSKEKKPIVIVTNNANNTGTNNTNNNVSSNNVSPNNAECCDGRICGAAPGCEDVLCGSCTEDEICSESGTCDPLAEGAPRIIDLAISNTIATPSNPLVISAIVTDPDGIDDLIGGTLKSPSGATYGAFQTAAAEGSYQLTLSWNQLNAVQPIVFEQPIPRDLVAEFYDQAGNKVQRSLNISLACDNGNEAACTPGVCVDLRTSKDHCGACNNTLEPIAELYCDNGNPTCDNLDYCPSSKTCASEYSLVACVTCDNNCETRATQIGLDLTHPDSELYCDGEGCAASIVSNVRRTCDAICGNAECYTSSASFSESGISASCDTNWADPQWDEYGTFISVNCSCIY